jgi:hypothetical protein
MGVALACATAGIGAGREALADRVPVIVLSTATAPHGEATAQLARINAALSGDAQLGPALGQALQERFGRRPPTANTLADSTARIDAARAAYNNAAASTDTEAMNAALDTLERIAGEFEAQPDILSAFPEAREQLARALLFVANTTIQSAPARADDAIRRLATADPQRVLSARAASSAVRQAFTQSVQQVATAGIVVESDTPGCEVFRSGRSVGNAPAQLSNLAPGSHHRISLRCGGRTSLVHPVTIASGSTSTFRIDIQLDSALDVLDAPTLRYSSLPDGQRRWVTDLAQLGRALGAMRVFGLIASEDKVIAIDVVSATIVGESSVTDGAQIRRLARGPAGSSGSRPSENNGTPAGTRSNGSNSGRVINGSGNSNTPNTNSNGDNSNTVRPPDVRVSTGSGARTPEPQYRDEVREVRGGVPAGAFVLGALGVGSFGAGIALGTISQSSLNRAQQLGRSATDAPRDRDGLLETAATYNYLAIGAHALGGVLVVTGTLVGIFARSTTTVTERVRISAAPLHGGGMVLVGGAL